MKALRVFESPDEISWPNLTYNQYGEPVDSNEWAPEFGATGSHAFWYENGEFVMGNEHGGHPLEVLRDKESYSGRVWADQKLISFWYYPSKFQFQDIAKELSEKLSRKRGEDINILEDPEWKVEILPENKKWHSQDPYVRDAAEKTWKTELVPAGEYGGSAQRSEEDLGQEHAKSPMLKKLSRDKVGGSKKYGKEKPLVWRQALVPESLEEALDFERGKDPKKALDIGQKGYMCYACETPTNAEGENLPHGSEEYKKTIDLWNKTPSKIENTYCADCYYNDLAGEEERRQEQYEREEEARIEQEENQRWEQENQGDF